MTSAEQAAAVVAGARAAFADATTLAGMPDDELAALAAQTAALSRIVQAQQVRLAGAIDARSSDDPDTDLCRRLGDHRPEHAVAALFRIRVREAKELLSLARATNPRVSLTGGDLESKYPQVGAALDDGELTLSQARSIVRPLEGAAPRADLDQLAWAEGCLVSAGIDPEAPLAPELLVEQGRLFAAVLDPDGVLPKGERQRAERRLRLWQRPDGMWLLDALLTPEQGSELKAAIDAEDAPRRRPRFVDDATGAAAEADAGPIDDRTPEQRRLDILVGIVRAFASSGAGAVAGGESSRLVLNVTEEAYDAYRRGVEHPDRTLQIEHTGALVPIETVDRLLCDAVVQRAVVDAAGEVLDLGRTERTFTRVQRRALAAQYGGCANCRAPAAWSEAHHVIWWSRGGTTDLKNGVLLCNHCHHEVHAGRLVVVGEPGDWRVVAQLRPADRYARASRSGSPRPRGIAGAPGIGRLARTAVARGVLAAAMRGDSPVVAAADAADPILSGPIDAPEAVTPLGGSANRTSSADAGPSLAVRIPEPPSRRVPEPPMRRASRVESRLRRRCRAVHGTGPQSRVPGRSTSPAPPVVMRT